MFSRQGFYPAWCWVQVYLDPGEGAGCAGCQSVSLWHACEVTWLWGNSCCRMGSFWLLRGDCTSQFRMGGFRVSGWGGKTCNSQFRMRGFRVSGWGGKTCNSKFRMGGVRVSGWAGRSYNSQFRMGGFRKFDPTTQATALCLRLGAVGRTAQSWLAARGHAFARCNCSPGDRFGCQPLQFASS